ncbi:MAG: DNA polymerase I [Phycisphaerae bacterium]|nr:DNA polymerase I [Phycisphaerae bacterium]
MSDKTLYIVDAHAHIFASYYALPGMSSPSGEPTNAVFGFTSTLLALLRDRRPDALAVVYDPPGPVFRNEIFPDYKANRDKTPDDLPAQVQRSRQVVAAMGLRPITEPGFEADDVIATLARLGRQAGYKVVIVSRDKDLEQLIGDGVVMYDAKKDREIDAAILLAEKGYRPDQAVDIQTLTGDSVDNVPGVPGVGPKTAAKLLAEFDTLANLLAHVDQIKGKVGEKIRASRDTLKLSAQLVRLKDDVRLDFGPDDLAPAARDKDKLAALFNELGFRRLVEQLSIADAAGAEAETRLQTADDQEYHCVDSNEALERLAADLGRQKAFAVDTETTGLDAMRAELVGLSFSFADGVGHYVPVLSPGGGGVGLPVAATLKKLSPALTDAAIGKVGHHLKYDYAILRQAGVQMQGLRFDTMLASYLLDPERRDHKLDTLAESELGHRTIPITELIGKGKDQISMRDVPLDRISQYAAEDADVTWRLYRKLAPQVSEAGLDGLLADLEMPLIEVLAGMEAHGVALDTKLLAQMSEEMESKAADLARRIHEAAGGPFNIDSTKQLAEVLFDRLKLPPGKKTKTGYSTDSEVLEELAGKHAVPQLVLDYRQLVKLKSTYVDALPKLVNPKTGRVHPDFAQTRAATGRLACHDPNLQNIPVRTEIGRQIRRAFVPGSADNLMLTADYSQVELRVLAHLSGDPALSQAFEQDQDIHSFVAAQVFDVPIDRVSAEQRRRAKAVNFGIIYGQTPFGLAKGLGIPQSDAAAFIDAYFAKYATIRSFMDGCIEQARKDGFVTTILGRRRRIPDIDSRNRMQRQLAERLAVNTVVQGSAADLIKRAMIDIHRRIHRDKLPVKMLIQVHDELVFELPAKGADGHAGMIRELMSGAIDLNVPLKVDIATGRSWLEAK